MRIELLAHLRRQWMGALALFLVLTGGTAYAANTVFSSDIVNGEVKSVDIGTGEVTGVDIDNGAVASADLANDSVNVNKVSTGAVRTAEIADGQVQSTDVLDNSITGADVDESTLSAGGDATADVTGPLSNLQVGPRTIGRSELASGAGPGCCSTSFFEFSIPANSCHIKTHPWEDANLGEIFFAFPTFADLGNGVYLRPTVVAHPGQVEFEFCNNTASAVTVPFGTDFQMRLIG